MKTRRDKYGAVKNPPPNRFVFHVAYGYTIQGRAYFASRAVTVDQPISDPRQIKYLERQFAEGVRANIKVAGEDGAALVGVADKMEVTVAVINITGLNAYYEQPKEEKPAPLRAVEKPESAAAEPTAEPAPEIPQEQPA